MAFIHFNNLNVFHNTNKNYDIADGDMEEVCGMKSLWRAVITQALMDAASDSKKSFLIKEKARAIAWLKGDSKNFLEVCVLADMDPEYVKAQARTAMMRNCVWRNDMRNHKKKHDNIYYGK